MSYFSQPKNGRDPKAPAMPSSHVNGADAVPQGPASTLGADMLITGNIVCAGAMQVYGRVMGDIHAARVDICEGAQVEGNVTALDTTVSGTFRGTIRSNSVRLQDTAVVDGEIFKNSLKVDENAQFEGMSRRLDRAVEAPTGTQLKSHASLVPAADPTDAPVSHS